VELKPDLEKKTSYRSKEPARGYEGISPFVSNILDQKNLLKESSPKRAGSQHPGHGGIWNLPKQAVSHAESYFCL
jgi:hypothetical protein